MKKFLAFIVALIIISALYFNKSETEAPSKPKFKFAKVSQGPISVQISATGIVEPNFPPMATDRHFMPGGGVADYTVLHWDTFRKILLEKRAGDNAKLKTYKTNGDLIRSFIGHTSAVVYIN